MKGIAPSNTSIALSTVLWLLRLEKPCRLFPPPPPQNALRVQASASGLVLVTFIA